MRSATVLLAIIVVIGVGLTACNDLRDFAGEWRGERVGDLAVLRVGDGTSATLRIDSIDKYGLRGHLVVVGAAPAVPLIDADFQSLEAAEADALSTMTFAGDPMRVYLSFVQADVLALIALYDARRIELRLLRAGPEPLYAIYKLSD